MTERLRDHPDDLDALVTQTASAGGLPAAYVEKDFTEPGSLSIRSSTPSTRTARGCDSADAERTQSVPSDMISDDAQISRGNPVTTTTSDPKVFTLCQYG